MQDLVRSLLWGIVGGLAVTIIAVVAGTRNPLELLVIALVAFAMIAVGFEVIQQEAVRSRLPNPGVRAVVQRAWARSPIDVRWRTREATVPLVRGFLDFERDWQRAIDGVNATIPKLTAEQERFTPILAKRSAALVAAKGTKVETRIRRAKESARDFKRHAETLERLERRLKEYVRTMTENYMALLANSTTRAAVSIPVPISTMRAGTMASSASIGAYRQTIIEIRNMSVEQEVNQSADRLVTVLGAVKADIDGIIEFCDKALVTINQNAAPPPRRAASRRPKRR